MDLPKLTIRRPVQEQVQTYATTANNAAVSKSTRGKTVSWRNNKGKTLSNVKVITPRQRRKTRKARKAGRR